MLTQPGQVTISSRTKVLHSPEITALSEEDFVCSLHQPHISCKSFTAKEYAYTLRKLATLCANAGQMKQDALNLHTSSSALIWHKGERAWGSPALSCIDAD